MPAAGEPEYDIASFNRMSVMMVNKQLIQFGSEQFDFISGEGIIEQVGSFLDMSRWDRFLVVTDFGVPEDIVETTLESLQPIAATELLKIHASEQQKTLTVLHRLAEEAIALNCDRRTIVVALGGGLVGNVAGMLAALLYRGLALIHIPTTFLAASDSVLSLKQAVNLKAGKNLVGLYYTPLMVLVELPFLQRLHPRHIRAGLCELVKNLLAIKPDRIEAFRNLLRLSNRYSTAELQVQIDFCIQAKMAVMEHDPHEKGPALILEYGHTIGHALELASEGELLHGECIAFGMLCAADISAQLSLLRPHEVAIHHELLNQIGLYVHPGTQILDRLMAMLKRDNKRGYRPIQEDRTAMVLLDGLGHLYQNSGHYLTLVDNTLIRATLEQLMAPTEVSASYATPI